MQKTDSVHQIFLQGTHHYPVKIFCLTVQKNFVEETFCVSENLWYRKMFRMRGKGGHHKFPSKFCCLTVPKLFVEQPFCVSEKLWQRKKEFMDKGVGEGGSIKIFREMFFVSQCRYFRKGTL